jgi:putative SOS response-associated peptidase YedK
MCGRYVLTMDPSQLVDEFDLGQVTETVLQPDYNVAPTKSVYIVVRKEEERALDVARWGLVPSWASNANIGSRMINARVETVDSKPSFRSSFRKRRCLVPANGYYEWYTPEAPGPKQPFYIHRTDGHPLAMAGLYSWWRAKADDDWLLTCTILTGEAPGELQRIHDRAPMLVPPAHWSAWLDAESGGDPKDLLEPVRSALVTTTPITTRVNNVRNNGPELLDPIAGE